MAHRIAFEPKRVDPKLELQRRLEAAPVKHAEALLVAYDTLQAAHDQGLLDMLRGAIFAKDAIAEQLASGADQPEVIAALRNLINLAKMLSAVDPSMLSNVSQAVTEAGAGEGEPPSLWQIFRRVSSREGRRGLGVAAAALVGLGTRRGK